MAPNTAVGWKPALCTALGTTRLKRHSTSTPTAIPFNAAAPSGLCRSQAASTAGTTTAPACTAPPPPPPAPAPPRHPLVGPPLPSRGAGAVVIATAKRCAHVILVA